MAVKPRGLHPAHLRKRTLVPRASAYPVHRVGGEDERPTCFKKCLYHALQPLVAFLDYQHQHSPIVARYA